MLVSVTGVMKNVTPTTCLPHLEPETFRGKRHGWRGWRGLPRKRSDSQGAIRNEERASCGPPRHFL